MSSETPNPISRLRGDDLGVSDKVLMAKVAAKDEAAFTQLYRQFSAPIFSMVYQILGDQKDTEDTIQETFVQIWKRADAYDSSRGNPFSWAVMIARNKAIDRIRSRQRQHHAAEVITEEFSHHPGIDDSAPAEQNDERSVVLTALSKLPADQREALELAFFGGLTHAEVSTELKTPLGTIKARIRRGLLTLHDLLKRK